MQCLPPEECQRSYEKWKQGQDGWPDTAEISPKRSRRQESFENFYPRAFFFLVFNFFSSNFLRFFSFFLFSSFCFVFCFGLRGCFACVPRHPKKASCAAFLRSCLMSPRSCRHGAGNHSVWQIGAADPTAPGWSTSRCARKPSSVPSTAFASTGCLRGDQPLRVKHTADMQRRNLQHKRAAGQAQHPL